MACVSILNLCKRFGTVDVLRDVNVEIADGEFAVLVGPSGCGKSTLLRSIAGLEEIDAGEIHVGRRLVNRMAPKDRDIAMVFQNYALYPHMTVAANMSFALELKKVGAAEMQARVQDAAQALGLAHLLHRYPRELSGGQRQRVAMGRAMVRDPQVFLFDEPLSNLDAALRVQTRAEIKGLHQRLKTTCIYVTHDQVEAMMMADRIVVLNAGRVEQVGPPLELYDRPANRFVAGFIGSPAMNFFEGRFGAQGFVAADGTEVTQAWRPPGEAGRPALMGVRPEHVRLSDRGMPGVIALVEPTGSETQISVRVGEQTVVCMARGRFSGWPGEVAHLQFESQGLHLFAPPRPRRHPAP
jgi:multiple sugar transport system ATP-binding protein